MSDSEKQTDESSKSEDLKRLDLERARHRTLKRPGKKEKRFSEIDGRYIPPPELQKEIDKLAEEKAKAAQKKKGMLGLFSHPSAPAQSEAEKKKTEELKAANRQIRELRGVKSRSKIRKQKKSQTDELPVFTDEPESEPAAEPSKRTSFLNTVKLLNAESAKQDVYKPLIAMPAQKKLPDGVVVDGLAYPLGVIYQDVHDLTVDRVVVVYRVLRKNGELLLDVYAPDTGRDGFIPVSRVYRLYALKTMTEINNPYDFLTNGIKTADDDCDSELLHILTRARYDVVLLAAALGDAAVAGEAKQKVVCDYISARCGFIAFDAAKLLDYIKTLGLNDAVFQEALDVLVSMPRDVVSNLVRAWLQVVLGGGIVRPKQRELTAELFYALRIAGIELNIMGL